MTDSLLSFIPAPVKEKASRGLAPFRRGSHHSDPVLHHASPLLVALRVLQLLFSLALLGLAASLVNKSNSIRDTSAVASLSRKIIKFCLASSTYTFLALLGLAFNGDVVAPAKTFAKPNIFTVILLHQSTITLIVEASLIAFWSANCTALSIATTLGRTGRNDLTLQHLTNNTATFATSEVTVPYSPLLVFNAKSRRAAAMRQNGLSISSDLIKIPSMTKLVATPGTSVALEPINTASHIERAATASTVAASAIASTDPLISVNNTINSSVLAAAIMSGLLLLTLFATALLSITSSTSKPQQTSSFSDTTAPKSTSPQAQPSLLSRTQPRHFSPPFFSRPGRSIPPHIQALKDQSKARKKPQSPPVPPSTFANTPEPARSPNSTRPPSLHKTHTHSSSKSDTAKRTSKFQEQFSPGFNTPLQLDTEQDREMNAIYTRDTLALDSIDQGLLGRLKIANASGIDIRQSIASALDQARDLPPDMKHENKDIEACGVQGLNAINVSRNAFDPNLELGLGLGSSGAAREECISARKGSTGVQVVMDEQGLRRRSSGAQGHVGLGLGNGEVDVDVV